MRVKGDHQKLKMLYLADIFAAETDDEHPLTLPQIAEKLDECGVNADRKTLYQDFEELRTYGMDILPYAMLFNMGTAWTSRFENLTILGAVETMEEMTKE